MMVSQCANGARELANTHLGRRLFHTLRSGFGRRKSHEAQCVPRQSQYYPMCGEDGMDGSEVTLGRSSNLTRVRASRSPQRWRACHDMRPDHGLDSSLINTEKKPLLPAAPPPGDYCNL